MVFLDTQIIILAAGKGTRMGAVDMPKVMTPLHGRPIASYLLDTCNALGFTQKPVFVVGFCKEKVIEYFDGQCLYAVQEKQLGTGNAVACAMDKINASNTLVLYGDMPFITKDTISRLLNHHYKTEADMTSVTLKLGREATVKDYVYHFGRVVRDDKGMMSGIVETKDADSATLAIDEYNSGVYVFKTDFLKTFINKITPNNAQGEYYLTDLLKLAVENNKKVESVLGGIDEMIGVNYIEDLALAEKMLVECKYE